MSQKTKRLTVSDEQLKESKGREMKDSREQDYDHILKRLEVNQQRMKEKMQKHISGSYWYRNIWLSIQKSNDFIEVSNSATFLSLMYSEVFLNVDIFLLRASSTDGFSSK